MDTLSELLSEWITRRDRMKFSHDLNGGGQLTFLRELEAAAMRMGDTFPRLSLAQWEALCELSSSYLSTMRNREAAFLKGKG